MLISLSHHENRKQPTSGYETVTQRPSLARIASKIWTVYFKGLGHAILGNFSIDQVLIELTEITK